jgi:hypothetical protein
LQQSFFFYFGRNKVTSTKYLKQIIILQQNALKYLQKKDQLFAAQHSKIDEATAQGLSAAISEGKLIKFVRVSLSNFFSNQ